MYLSAMRYPVFFLPTAFICICFNYVVLLERTNKDIIYIAMFQHFHIIFYQNLKNDTSIT